MSFANFTSLDRLSCERKASTERKGVHAGDWHLSSFEHRTSGFGQTNRKQAECNQPVKARYLAII
jgi:hypothetical protein